MAFILAGLIAAAAIGLQVLVIFAEASRPIPNSSFMGVFWPVTLGLPLAGLIVASHWLPHIGW